MYIGKDGGKTKEQQLAYEFQVLDVDVEASIDDSNCALAPNAFDMEGKRIRMKLVRRIPSGLITLQDLLDHGLSKHPQSQMKVPFELQKFIDTVFC